MKNKEKFAKEIVEIAINTKPVAVKKDGTVAQCYEFSCRDCMFWKEKM
mgnify:FL=1